MSTIGAGSGAATIIMTPVGELLPTVVRIPLATTLAAVSAVPAIKQWCGELNAYVRHKRERRRRKDSNGD